MAAATEAATTSAPEPRGGRSEGAAAAESERLFALHHRMVIGLCRALLRDPTEAEDAAQQAFLSAHRALLNGAVPREPAAWLATIARNECWSRISGRMRQPLAADTADTVAATDDPVAAAIRNADLAALWRAIRALPRAQRDALLLREFGGLRYDELAVALAVSEPAVESLLVRARSRLRAQLQAAYASLAPAARFLVGNGGPAVAAKAVALGLGAAAVTGGAVVAPEMLTHHHLRAPAQRAHARPRTHGTVLPVAAVLPLTVAAARTAAVLPPPTATVRREETRRQPRDDGRTTTAAAAGDGTPTERSSEDGGQKATTTAGTTTVETTTTAATTTDGGGGSDGPGGGSGDSGSSDGSDG